MPDRPVSRRETLKRAASALALGCVAPAALATPAPLAPEAPTFRLSVFAPDGTLIQALRLSDAAGRKLRDSGPLSHIKFDSVDGEAAHTLATFDLRTG